MRRFLRVALINLGVLLGMYGLAEAALHLVSAGENPLFGHKLRVPDPVFHHTLRANFAGTDVWGNQSYPVFTNALGFKDSSQREVPLRANKPRVLFIGDSFTEGVGLPYEQTFVGLFARAHPELDVLDAGVVSYAPSAYYEKIKYFLAQGLTFDQVILYMDISDVRDEAVGYCYDNRGILQMRDLRLCEIAACPSGEEEQRVWWKEDLKKTLYIPDFIYQSIKRRQAAARAALETPPPPDNEQDAVRPGAVYGRDSDPRASWTYDPGTKCFGSLGIGGGIAKAKERMDRLYELLSSKGIPLSIGVYPWPQQLLYDDEESLQVRLWRTWCEGKCARFFDHFPAFFRYKRAHPHFLREIYVWGDVHYNERGNRILADDLLAQYAGGRMAGKR